MAIGPPIWITDNFEALVFGMSIHATFFTFKWELSPSSGNALCILFPTDTTCCSCVRIYYLKISSSANFIAVASLCISSGNLSSLALGSCSGSGNSSLPVGMLCAFYSHISFQAL
nr:hypothetical protein [Tanacetum cinerariifolium]